MPESMPTFDSSRTVHRGVDRLFLRMNVALRDVHVAMPGEVGERPWVRVGSPGSQAGMA